MTPASAFADSFSAFGLVLPDEVVQQRLDGQLSGRSWNVRWRWLADGALEVRAVSRFTNERWFRLGADGTLDARPVPPEMFVVGDDPAASEAENRAAWHAHGLAVEAAGMAFPPAPTEKPAWGGDPDRLMLWAVDGATAWSAWELPARPAR